MLEVSNAPALSYERNGKSYERTGKSCMRVKTKLRPSWEGRRASEKNFYFETVRRIEFILSFVKIINQA